MIVSGYVTTERKDFYGDVIPNEWAKGALKEWFDVGGRMRVMHQSRYDGWNPGRARAIKCTKNGVWLQVEVTDRRVQKMIRKGELAGFSVDVIEPVDHGALLTGHGIWEISLVDRPANPDCLFKVESSRVKSKKKVDPSWARDEINKFYESITYKPVTPTVTKSVQPTFTAKQRKILKEIEEDMTWEARIKKAWADDPAMRHAAKAKGWI